MDIKETINECTELGNSLVKDFPGSLEKVINFVEKTHVAANEEIVSTLSKIEGAESIVTSVNDFAKDLVQKSYAQARKFVA